LTAPRTSDGRCPAPVSGRSEPFAYVMGPLGREIDVRGSAAFARLLP
jgi:hypothetical protein